MARGNVKLIDKRVAETLQGRQKLRALVVARSATIQKWAQSHGFYPEQVHRTLSGERAYPEVREAMASDFDIPRAEIDLLLDESATETASV